MAKAGPKTPAKKGSEPATAATRRRDKLASLEAARKAEQRRRSLVLLVVCIVLASGLLAYPVWLFIDDYRARHAGIEDLGVSAAAARCDAPTEEPARGNQEHVDEGTKVDYAQYPPDSGPHYPTPAPFTKHFYAVADRPAVETLVHNLEHGYTIAWYRADAPDDQIKALNRIAKTFATDTYDPANKFIAAPWSPSDGDGFPAGKNLVLARWTANPANPGDTTQQRGVREACESVSGAAIKDFMAKYPPSAAPEPNAG